MIDVVYDGIADLGVDGHAAFLRGEIPDILAIRAAPRMRTSHPAHAWVNRALFVNIGEAYLEKSEVTYDIYKLS